jgi:hypothetical protein
MKINKDTISRMKSELLAVFAVHDGAGHSGTREEFVKDRIRRGCYWVRAHVWAIANLEAFPEEKRHLFKDFPFNPDHELYPCGSNDSHVATALKQIAKELSES